MAGFFKKIGDFLAGRTTDDVDNDGLEKKHADDPAPKPDAPADESTKDEQPEADEPQPQPQKPQKVKKKAEDNPIDHRDKIIKKAASYIKKNNKKNLIPVIWAASEYFNSIISNKSFEDAFRAELANIGLVELSQWKIDFRFAQPQEEDKAEEIYEGLVFVSFVKRVQPNQSGRRARASITIYDNAGTMAQNEYILDSDKKKTYHIGREKSVKSGDGKMRINDIIIGSAEESERNARVSRTHATIVYMPGSGRFAIHADAGGCSTMGGQKTRVIKTDDVKDLSNITSKVVLEDGDIIELSRETGVKLLFKKLDS